MLPHEVVYGFINESNILIDTAVILKDDLETLERIKNQYNAFAAYQMDLTKESTIIGQTYWNGNRFIHPKPIEYPSFIWSDEKNNWIPPIPAPDESKMWYWSEEDLSWHILEV